MTSIWPDDTPPRTQHAQKPTPLDNQTALRALGGVIIYLTFAPPLAVILWRLATAPWW